MVKNCLNYNRNNGHFISPTEKVLKSTLMPHITLEYEKRISQCIYLFPTKLYQINKNLFMITIYYKINTFYKCQKREIFHNKM